MAPVTTVQRMQPSMTRLSWPAVKTGVPGAFQTQIQRFATLSPSRVRPGELPHTASPDGSAAAVAVRVARSILGTTDSEISPNSALGAADTTPHPPAVVYRGQEAKQADAEAAAPPAADARSLASELTQLRCTVDNQERIIAIHAQCIEEVRAEIKELRQSVSAVQAASAQAAQAAQAAQQQQLQQQQQQQQVPPLHTFAHLAQQPRAMPSGPPSSRGGPEIAVEPALDAGAGGPGLVVWLDKSTGGELGLELDERSLTVTVVDEVGLVADWNRRNPTAPVIPGHRIVEVNGEHDLEKILDRLIRDLCLEVKLAPF